MISFYSVFGCGHPQNDFDEKTGAFVESLGVDQRLMMNTLAAVAWRVWLTSVLRYQTELHPQLSFEEEFHFSRTVWPSLEIYLLITCLDVFTSETGDRPNFKRWMREHPKSELNASFTTKAVIDLYYDYQREHGVGSNLLRLFQNLPDITKAWLDENIEIRMDNEPINEELEIRLFDYFYNVRRNPFTHRVEVRFTDVVNVIDIGKDFRLCDEYDPNPDPAEPHVYHLYIRRGLDLATVLRVLIQSVVLQRLGYVVSNTDIERATRNYKLQSLLYGFVFEVKWNLGRVNLWRSIKTHELIKQQLIALLMYPEHVEGALKFHTEYLELLLKNSSYLPLSKHRTQFLSTYIAHLSEHNLAVHDFSRQLAELPRVHHDRWAALEPFIEEQAATKTFQFISSNPSSKELWVFERLAEAPCYPERPSV